MSKKSTAAIKVLIADDHAIVREGLRQICAGSKDIVVAGNAANGLEAIKLAREGNGDVMLLDIVLPDRSGIDILKQIRKEQPDLPVLILSIHREDQYAIRSLKAGAAGFLNKQASPGELLAAIRQAAAGRKYVSPSLAQELANQIGFDHDTPLHETLSDREYQTMVMIASGKTVSDIASELLLSVKTISMYRSRVLAKMKMRHNAELTHYALKNNLVE
ncbi:MULTISPECIES: response regulator [Herbaspirillum]|jgi:two-component system invasion response regulator UvrY|uniref:Response regulator transcription factor n=3 Tax=Herbaspirillum huttiense TaxID=863372 RepID=A0AAJ2H6H2_9BURK|nr:MULTISPECIES: response regulator transcription factor [Herbaspirillum]MAF03672.1 DNA-binding response regulator [Herbaspirillum sp.]MBN9355464.1 response regulator transcription factor [Herbaspirillum huttiense]MBO16874.1 DNA-binding response regulator [Herbaspirillum sp.]MBP1313878.1 DNA-binding NarL/FixJ family response regulator [Herbaspirillum sp. 1130]MCO4856105.1 response regulator transcription factor [Herbaspirillum sp. WGmk3]|tara:strand:- start:209 stop:862 length:654 start_codon:yes stop_codon:yes gene_type:complete